MKLLIVQTLDAIYDIDRHGIVFDIVDCRGLTDVVDNHAGLPFRHAVPYFHDDALLVFFRKLFIQIEAQPRAELWIEDPLSGNPCEYLMQAVLNRADIDEPVDQILRLI